MFELLFHLSRFVSMKILFEQLLFTFFTYLQVFSFKVAIIYFHFKLSFGLKISLHVHIHIMLKIQVGIDSENTCTFFF